MIIGGNSTGEQLTNKDGVPSNDMIISNNSGSQGPKGQRGGDRRNSHWRNPTNNKPKETLVNGTSG